MRYEIIAVTSIRNSCVVTLNRELSAEDRSKSRCMIDGKQYPFGLTHNEQMITIHFDGASKGQTLIFC